jgi:hypothetical protein
MKTIEIQLKPIETDDFRFENHLKPIEIQLKPIETN